MNWCFPLWSKDKVCFFLNQSYFWLCLPLIPKSHTEVEPDSPQIKFDQVLSWMRGMDIFIIEVLFEASFPPCVLRTIGGWATGRQKGIFTCICTFIHVYAEWPNGRQVMKMNCYLETKTHLLWYLYLTSKSGIYIMMSQCMLCHLNYLFKRFVWLPSLWQTILDS